MWAGEHSSKNEAIGEVRTEARARRKTERQVAKDTADYAGEPGPDGGGDYDVGFGEADLLVGMVVVVGVGGDK